MYINEAYYCYENALLIIKSEPAQNACLLEQSFEARAFSEDRETSYKKRRLSSCGIVLGL